MDRPLFDPSKIAGPEPVEPAPTGSLLTVSQVTALVKRALTDHLPPTVHVVGEISNFKRHASGHLYLTLKDEHCELACVMWRSAASRLKFRPENGLEVVATGNVDVFERTGRYQLYVRKLEPRGLGGLELAFRQLHQKLQAQGLFDPARKRPLPRFPQRIAVVTSPTGAAIRDILRTLQRRYACGEVFVFPVTVQGPSAAGEIARAIDLLGRRHRRIGGIDVVIVGRGGGSLEDLWAFNEEVVARAIHACSIPVVSAVGHEVDMTISDLVADVRAATPTAAAELVAPAVDDVLRVVAESEGRLARGVAHRVELMQAAVNGVLQRSAFRDPLAPVHQRDQIIDEITARMSRAIGERMHAARQAVARCELTLQRIHPRSFAAEAARRLTDTCHRLRWALWQCLSLCERRLAKRSESLVSAAPDRRVAQLAERVNRIERRTAASIAHRHSLAVARVDANAEKLQAMSYRTTLARGFSITRTRKDRKVVRDVRTLRAGDRLVTETVTGEVDSTVVGNDQMELFE